ncbi:MAG: hypothetical protein M0027_05390 [Candidatus Dormibacteraeota bacterium]|nr:hypothetical protein [Candidatus Dormibacteraeota bacterium]
MTVHKIAGGDTAGYVAYLASQRPERRRSDYYLGPEGRPHLCSGGLPRHVLCVGS